MLLPGVPDVMAKFANCPAVTTAQPLDGQVWD
jgi:hypothetical protein